MDISITDVILSKEITWNEIKDRDILFADMMRNRVTIKATVSQQCDYKTTGQHGRMWDTFLKEVRRFCDGKNVALYCIRATTQPVKDGQMVSMNQNGFYTADADGYRGEITIYFEDAGDYVRFLKEKAVMFKLSINTQ